MAVAAVVAARDMRQHAHLLGRQRAVGNGDPQHIGVQLQIDAVHQPQRLEFVLGQFAGQAAANLIAEFSDALIDERLVEIVVEIHGSSPRECDGGAIRANAFAQIAGEHALVGRELHRRDIGLHRKHPLGRGRRE